LTIFGSKVQPVDHNPIQQESPADAGIPARPKNDEKNSSISKL